MRFSIAADSCLRASSGIDRTTARSVVAPSFVPDIAASNTFSGPPAFYTTCSIVSSLSIMARVYVFALDHALCASGPVAFAASRMSSDSAP